MMISQENYDILKEKYGDASSWAVWNTDYADSKPSRNINDLSVFDSPNLSELSTGFVFVGLNRSGKPKDGNAEKKPDKPKDPWFNFPCGKERFQTAICAAGHTVLGKLHNRRNQGLARNRFR